METSFAILDPNGNLWCNLENQSYFSNISKAKSEWNKAHWDMEQHKLLDFDKDGFPDGWRIAKVERKIFAIYGGT